MIRSEVLKSIIPIITDKLVVCNIGLPSQELHLMDDQPSNFYMLGTMGLSSSIGLGLALAQKDKVIAIDGDGSVLTNFGTLPTIANNVADNFVLLIRLLQVHSNLTSLIDLPQNRSNYLSRLPLPVLLVSCATWHWLYTLHCNKKSYLPSMFRYLALHLYKRKFHFSYNKQRYL